MIETGENLGFAGGCHVGAELDAGAAAAVPQPRLPAAAGTVCERLRAAAAAHPDWGAWQAAVLLDDERINTSGGVVHFLGIGWAGDCERPISALPEEDREIPFPSGAAMVVRRSAWTELGGLDRDYFMYGEDLDLGLRLWLAGHRVGLVPAARVTHSYEFDKGSGKWFWLERNRWRTVLSVYPTALLVLLVPALLAAELGLLAIAARQGWLGAKLRAQAATIAGLPRTLARRRAVQGTRRIGATEFASCLTSSLDSPYLRAADSRWLSVPQALYWRLVRRRPVPAGALMRVGLDLLYLVPGETGGRETYARELVPALLERAPELELVAFVNRDAGPRLAAELGDGVRAVVVPVSARSRAQWALGELALVSVAARRARVEVLHSMANFAPAWGRFRRVVTIHDLHYRAVPELLSWPMRTGTSALVSLAAHRSHRMIADLAAALVTIWSTCSASRPTASTWFRSAYACRQRWRPSWQPRRASAYDLPDGRSRWPWPPISLIRTSPRSSRRSREFRRRHAPCWSSRATAPTTRRSLARATAVGVSEDVRLLGRCASDQLESLYKLADCLVVPSLHEGFGLPVLEAMTRSVPVVCSDIPALREVAGSAALYFDPRVPAQIAIKLGEMIADTGLAERMRELGRARAAGFSWSAAAEGTLESYRRALET